MGKTELLSPCGSESALAAAIAGGADAVYLGGWMLNARMNAKNFDREGLLRAVQTCHASGVKLYVTLNTQVLDREMGQALSYAAFLHDIGVDALIVADLGLAALIREQIPSMPLHASTQMTGHSAPGALELQKRGFCRMVCPREIGKEDLIRLCAESPIEIEAFVHGAICVSCSGQCMLSAVMGGRSGNRGECAQPCRMPYNGAYPLSMKDLCLARHVPELIEAGVKSFKIEGRMKSPSYVYGVTKIYRRLIDEHRSATDGEMKELAKLFSRSGFTDGYFTGNVDETMLGVRKEDDISATRRQETSVFAPVRKALPKIEVVRDRAETSLPSLPKRRGLVEKPIMTARFRSGDQIVDEGKFAVRYLPLNRFSKGAANGVILPPVIFDTDRDEVRRGIERAVKMGAAHILISGISQLALARESGLCIHADWRWNLFNTFSALEAAKEGVESVILSPELILPQVRDITLPDGCKKGFFVYGRLPLMLLEKPVGVKELRDRKSAKFPVMRENGRDILYNSVITYMADQTDRLDASGIAERHFIFSDESRAEVLRAVYAYEHGVLPKDPVRRIK